MPLSERSVWPPELASKAPPLARWDAGWYRTIAIQGYGHAPPPRVFSEHAFFPLYPWTVGLVSRATGVDPFVAGSVISIGALFAAAYFFVREGRERSGDRQARHAAIFLLLFPTSFFLVAPYSEALFLLLALLAFRGARRRRLLLTVVCGALAGLTRPSALALAVPLALAWREASPEGASAGRPGRSGALLASVAPAIAVFAWIIGLGAARGEPGLFFRVQSVWERGPALGAASSRAPAPPPADRETPSPSLALDVAALVLFCAIGFRQARRRRWSDAAWIAGAILLPLSTGTLMSLSRYLVVVYPAFFVLAEALDGRPRLRFAWWLISGALLAACVAAFVHWRWVA